MISPILLLAIVVAACASMLVDARIPEPTHLMFTRSSVPTGWRRSLSAKPTDDVHFFVSLQQENLDELDRIFTRVSDPFHEDYQQFLTKDEIQALVAPQSWKRERVAAWLQAAGVSRSIDFVDSVEVWTTVEVAEQMFATEFYEFAHIETGHRVVRAFGAVKVPQEIHDAIDSVMGLSTFPVPHLAKHKALAAVNDAIIPQTIWSLYSMPTNYTIGSSTIAQSVIEWEGQSFDPADLAAYSKAVGITITPVTAGHIVGPNVPKQPGDEASLDIQFIAAVNPTATNWFWIEGDSVWLYGFAVHFLNTTNVPDIMSISYGWWEGDQCEEGIGYEECQKIGVKTEGYVARVNTEFQKIGVRGVSVFVSSGDSGAHTRSDEYCAQNHTLADFPGSSPYITSVGATQVNSETFFDPTVAPICADKKYNFMCVQSGTEVAVNSSISSFTSGGGFSNISRRLSYQEDAVQVYLKNTTGALPPMGWFNLTGRGYPDVSAVGHNGLIIDGGQYGLIGGTSQSAPTFAAVASLLANAFKTKTGKSFGFMNPVLYAVYAAAPAAFIDIVEGNNICTEATARGCPKCKGYTTAKGWDAVTGLGSPNYKNMLAYINTLADKVVARRALKAEGKAAEPSMYKF